MFWTRMDARQLWAALKEQSITFSSTVCQRLKNDRSSVSTSPRSCSLVILRNLPSVTRQETSSLNSIEITGFRSASSMAPSRLKTQKRVLSSQCSWTTWSVSSTTLRATQPPRPTHWLRCRRILFSGTTATSIWWSVTRTTMSI